MMYTRKEIMEINENIKVAFDCLLYLEDLAEELCKKDILNAFYKQKILKAIHDAKIEFTLINQNLAYYWSAVGSDSNV